MGWLIFFIVLSIVCILLSIFLDYNDKCYNQMESEGRASFGICGGVAGGDKSTEYLSYSCIDCPYYVWRNSND